MKSFIKIPIIVFSILASSFTGYSQSCVIDRVPSSDNLPQAGGQTYQFGIITYGNCTPIFTVSHSWLTYTYTSGYLQIAATANPGPPRVGYVYVDNKESLKITINQAGSFVPVTGVTVSPSTAFLSTGETKSLTATVSPSNATTKTVTWSSNQPSVASVNASSGVVTGVGSGTAIITATTVSGGRTANCTVTVTAMEKSFSWSNKNGQNFTTPVKDQQTQDPCFLFAAVGALEAKYKIWLNDPYASIDLSEGQVNIVCLNGPLSIPAVFAFSQSTGIVNETCYPYSQSIYGNGPGTLDCTTPCENPGPAIRVKVSGYTCIDFSTIAVSLRADYLKDAIKQHGPVAVSFKSPGLHNDAMHAYELYGWNESNWQLKDSWPGAPRYNLQTSVNIPNELATNQPNFKACYINGISSTNPNGRIGMAVNNEMKTPLTLRGNQVLYPNPATTEITLDNIPANGQVTIYKSDGTLVGTRKVTDNKVDVSELVQGIYFIKVKGNQTINVLKFIKL